MDQPSLTLVDASVWIEMFRGTGSPAHRDLLQLLRSDAELATSEPVLMELLAGAASPRQARTVRRALAACRNLAVRRTDWERAASIHLACRRSGETPRKLLDCMLAAVAIRAGVPVLARDRDFEAISRHTALELA